ncbi:unnamed protein product [Parnassius apollo]|uniref:(apollo) hypothetical protein n=1 Tax=Parnassius apollo TaxID=110799 RepID=A0A8S3W054_PARAO|nr:unnamed protein product [Parnassius apollo]
MDLLVSIFLLYLSAGVRSESLHDTLEERSIRDVYASNFGAEFESIAYAAIPLYPPIPIIRIISPSFTYKFGYPYDKELEPNQHYYARRPTHSASMIDSRITELSTSSSEMQAPEIIYARPNKRGGFTYRRPAAASHRPVEPIVLRVQKYKVVRDR